MCPLGPQSLPTEYGVLAYATLGDQPLLRLTTTELRQQCPDFPETWYDAAHCLRTVTDNRPLALR